jgi:hypothetical protein
MPTIIDLRFLEWYSGCLKEAYKQSLNNPDYGFIDLTEELLLNEAMKMMHGQKWNGEKWIKAHEGYDSKPGSNLYMGRQY